MPRRPRPSVARLPAGAASPADGRIVPRREVVSGPAFVRLLVAALVAGGAFLGTAAASAQVGESGDALPGIVRIPVHEAAASERPVVLAGTAAYGFTESVLESGEDVHHRVEGGLALGWRPTSWLGASLRIDGRYDRHLGPTPEEDDDGFVGLPRLAVRLGTQVSPAFSLGTQVAVAFPGAEAPSIVGDAISADVEAFGALRISDATTVAFRAGWRFDEGPDSIDAPQDLSPADRLGLGLSDADAVLLGLGLSGRLSRDLELLAEWTWDLLVGEAAPAASEAPMRIGGGFRWRPLAGAARDRLEVQAIVDGTVSRRPDLSDPLGPLVPVEPRVRVLLGLTARLGGAPSTPETSDEDGGDGEEGGEGEGEGVDDGDTASGSVDDDVEEGDPDAPIPDDQVAPVAPATGELRGVVRSYSGRSIRATVRVEVGGTDTGSDDHEDGGEDGGGDDGDRDPATADGEDADDQAFEAETDRYGAFSLTLPVGEHIIVIEARRYRTQRRRVQVEEGGVTILNADLRRGRSRPSRGGRGR